MRRTGSNHLFTVLRNLPGLASCGELFNADKVSGSQALLPEIRRISGLRSRVEEDPFLRGYARGNPGGFLDVLAAAVARQGKHVYCFKVFEDQLPRQVIESQILDRPGMRMVLLVRRAVDAYISLQKARRADEWVGHDTTGTPIALDAHAFAEWLDLQRDWYRHWLARAAERGEGPTILTYEEDVDRPLRIVLRRFARTAGRLDIRLRMPLLLRVRGLRRQDRNARLEARVENWAEFHAGLARLGLERQAFEYPM